ncbi:MAG: hypothetical protein QOD62_1044 [Actinomycetota bacterium]|nr:hypothetical protein [Actinomycetota bacterium]
MRLAAPAPPTTLPERGTPRPPASKRFDGMVAILGTAFAGGLYLDGWAHVHGHVDQSFFTPWHAVLYSGFLVLAAVVGVTARAGLRRGLALRESVPPGYELSLLGAAIFLVGGVADMAWHIVFGIEANVDALFSPTHLVLAIGGVLLASGPLRSAWRRADSGNEPAVMPWPAVLSVTAVLAVITFLLQIAHPLVNPQAAGSASDFRGFVFYQQALGVSGVVIQTAVLMGLVLLAARRFVLPFGTLTTILGLNAFGLSFLSRQVGGSGGGLSLVPAALVAGLLADTLYAALRGNRVRNGQLAFRLFAFGVPAIFYLVYFLSLLATTGIWWSIHLWLGSVAVAGITGWLLSYVAVPPAMPR